MFEILAITNRLLCPGGKENYLKQIEKIASSGINALILREKDLCAGEYTDLAKDVSALCAKKKLKFIIHGFIKTAAELGCPYIHVPWILFSENYLNLNKAHITPGTFCQPKASGAAFGVSVHSQAEARFAEANGASWLIAGHIYKTQCKPGLENRGLEFLTELCQASAIPIYGIGGINENNIADAAKTGAAGICLMSSLMQSLDPSTLVGKLRDKL